MLTAAGVIACGATALPEGPLSDYDHQRATERGQRFTASEYGATPRASGALPSTQQPYRLEHLTGAHPPRIHPRMDASLFVLSGAVRIRIDGVDHQLGAGDSIDIPHGSWYCTESTDSEGSSVYFVFLPGQAPAGSDNQRHASAEAL